MTTPVTPASRPAAPAGRHTINGPRPARTAGPGTSTRKQRFLTVTKPYDTIGPLLARLRQARGYSQLTLAQLLCATTGHPTITRHEVSRWERQERIPSKFWLRPLADVLAVPIDTLRAAVASTRTTRHTDDQDEHAEAVVTSWLALHHGPRELLIALGGIEIDQIRTVLSPVHPSDPPTGMEASE